MPSHTYSKEALNKAVTKYVKQNYDRITIRLTKESGLKQQIDNHISQTGESLNAFAVRAIKEALENDKNKNQ